MRERALLFHRRRFGIALSLAVVSLLAFCEPAMTTSSPIPKHVLTWAYDGGYGGRTDGATETSTNPQSQRHIQTWLSFAEGSIQINGHPEKAYYDCPSGGPCKSVIYYNPAKLFTTCWPDRLFITQNTSEDYYLHDGFPVNPSNRTAHTKFICGGAATLYFPNLSNPAVGQWWTKNILWLIQENTNTLMFQDNSGGDCKGRFRYGEFVPYELQGASSCEKGLATALRTVADQMHWMDGTPVPVVVNGLGVGPKEAANTASLGVIAPGSQIIGGVEENSEIYLKHLIPHGIFGGVNTASLVYATNPAALYGFLAQVNANPGSTQTCVDAANNVEDSCGALQLRRDMLASFWLAYTEGHTFLWENFNDSGMCCGGLQTMAVYPEASIYPTNPVQALKTFDTSRPTTNGSGCGPQPGSGGIQSFVIACGTLNDGATPGGVYVREFRQCYNFGQLIGAGQCAVVMNMTNQAVSVGSGLTQRYTHLMTLGSGPRDGGDVLTAGCDNGQCPKSAINPLGEGFVAGQTQAPAFDAVFLFHN